MFLVVFVHIVLQNLPLFPSCTLFGDLSVTIFVHYSQFGIFFVTGNYKEYNYTQLSSIYASKFVFLSHG